MSTLHWSNADVEVHKLVVGSYDNNVFIVRCTATGEAVLIDAANEHERLLELSQALGVRRILETHGHHDHIGAVTEMREAGYEVAVTAADAPMLNDVGYDVLIDDKEVIEFGSLRLHAIHNPGHTPGSISFHLDDTPLLFTGDTLFPGGPGATQYEGGDFNTIITSIDELLFRFLMTRSSFRGTALTPPLEPSALTFRSGSTGVGKQRAMNLTMIATQTRRTPITQLR
jgi:glyoxylase-like metal-dependent hydrolase (beta-lactamase superfamily II)